MLSRYEVSFHSGLCSFFFSDGLAVSSTLCRSIQNHLLVLPLCIFFCEFRFLALFLNFGLHHVHHCQHPPGLLTFLLVCSRGLWWGRWWGFAASPGMQERNSSASNATWRVCWSQGATHVQSNALLLTELTLWWWLVQLGIIKLVESIFSNSDDLDDRSIRCHLSFKISVFLLA